MKFIFLKVVCSQLTSELKTIREEQLTRHKAIEDLKKQWGALSIREYNYGGIAFIQFPYDKEIDRKIWKKAHDGFYPKAKTSELNTIRNLPQSRDYMDAFEDYGKEMVLGESTGRGFPMYSSGFSGNFDKDLFFIKVPYNGESYTKEISPAFELVKEWEYLKEMDGE